MQITETLLKCKECGLEQPLSAAPGLSRDQLGAAVSMLKLPCQACGGKLLLPR